MLKRSLVTAVILALAASFAVSAAESVPVTHPKQFTFADDPSHPINNTR